MHIKSKRKWQGYLQRCYRCDDFIDVANTSNVTEDNNNILDSSHAINSAATNSNSLGIIGTSFDSIDNRLIEIHDIKCMITQVRKNKRNGYISYRSSKHTETPISSPTTKLNASNPTNKLVSNIYAEVWKPL